MFFRPEEVHGTSAIRGVLQPLPERYSHVPNHIPWFRPQNDPIPDFHLDGFSAIEARRIDLNRLPRKKPADRQRFKSSLAEPFLLAIDADAILGREVVERSEGGDEIRIWKEPSRNPGSEKFVETLSPLLHRNTQFGCDLGVMGRLTGLYHSTHDNMECSVEIAWFTHGLTS